MMNMDEMKAVALKAFNDAENPYDKDEVMSLIFSNGIPFNKLTTLYRIVGQEGGFIASPEEIKDGIIAGIEDRDSDIENVENWADVEELVDAIVDEVSGSTTAKVLKALREYAKENEYELPSKTRTAAGTRKKGGKTAEAILAFVTQVEADAVSLHSLYKAIRPVVKGPKNAYDCVNSYFAMVYGSKTGKTLDAVNEDIAKMDKLVLKDLEAAEAA